MSSRSARLRPVWFGLTVVLLGVAAYIAVNLYHVIDDQQAVGVDFRYYQFVAQRWLDTGVYYTQHQLDGPYQVTTLIDNLYPPHALYLFVPFVVVPGLLWWILPLGFMGYVTWWCRPAAWMWPILAAILVFPKTPNQIIYGNTDMWIGAFIAGGVRWGWPSVFISIKPSLAVFGLIGIRSRRWWIAALVLALVSLPFLALWLLYPTVLRNSSAGWYYSFGNLPFFLLPVIAWLGSRYRGSLSMGRWAWRLIGGDRSPGPGGDTA